MPRDVACVEPQPAVTARAWRLLAVGSMVPLAIAVALHVAEVPLGCPGRFVYLYSPVSMWRLMAVPVALALALLLGVGTWLTGGATAGRRYIGLVVIAVTAAALGIWSYCAPPHYFNQHVFNAHSPSQDGAFVREAVRMDDVRAYLRDFPARAHTPPAEMRGTRVVSNPPGTTLLAVGMERLTQRYPGLRDVVLGTKAQTLPPTAEYQAFRRSSAVGLLLFWGCTLLWVLAVPVLYGVGRLYLPPAGATAFSLVSVFTPATLLLTPGKDPAQLLMVALPLLLWLFAIRRTHAWAAGLAGCAFVLACLASLVPIWIAGTVLLATLLAARAEAGALRRALLYGVLPAGGAALLTTLVLYAICDLNLPATVLAVSQAQREVTRGPQAMPLVWQLLGVPLFMLFVGPASWCAMLWWAMPSDGAPRPADTGARFGRYLFWLTVAVLLATAGFTNIETPRLWIPFVPLLVLGAALQVAHWRRPGPRAALLLGTLVGVHLAVAALHWSFMDMREAETRLAEQRYFDRPAPVPE